MNSRVEGQPKQAKGFNKVIIILIAALLVAGGSAAAFFFLDKSDKEKYFAAEKNTIDFYVEEFQKRYQSELDWNEYTQENPVESVLEISAEYNDPTGASYGLMSPEQIINNSTITVTAALDRENKQLSSSIVGSLGGFEIDGLEAYLTSEKVMLGLPFLEEILQLKGDDFGSLLSQLDPSFSGDETIDFGQLFEGNVFPEEDIEYLKENYVKSLFEEIPDTAFEVVDETVKVKDSNVDTEKITFHLTEEEVQDLLSNLFTKMSEDDRLKEIIKEQFANQTFGALTMPSMSSMIEEEANQLADDFTAAMEEASDAINDISIPEGLTSTIWVNKDDVIVKRNFALEMGPSADETISLSVDGDHVYNGSKQSFEYTFGFSDPYSDEELVLAGDLSFENDVIEDVISLQVEGADVTLETNESLTNDGKEFERVISVSSDELATGQLVWSGDATYEKDQMQSNHQFSVESPDIPENLFYLNLTNDSKAISSVELPSESDVKDLGSMDINELMMYFESEVAPQFEQWLNSLMGPGF
ncbi:flagellar basal body-associated FliL family protein [Ornithinibacillus halophilus]|uniref:DUF945 domain-containing protein n=1 Tax=Ornithinibacillus halophilus TaxID=930117 RepID=A0A1M5J3E1_9BACI|nr:DUF6583 family protein [Ornithinibacillus halophilus]SHG34523.1 hypothetical protein SAMN05216225_102745 [Ornithinibacillus halophilus]